MLNYLFIDSTPQKSTIKTIFPLITLIIVVILIVLAVKKFIIKSKHKSIENYICSCASVLITVLILVDINQQGYTWSNNFIGMLAFWSALISIFSPYNESSKPSLINNAITGSCYVLAVIDASASGISIIIIVLSFTNCFSDKIFNYIHSHYNSNINSLDEKTESKNESDKDNSEFDKIMSYKQLYDMGIITEEEFIKKKKELLKL